MEYIYLLGLVMLVSISVVLMMRFFGFSIPVGSAMGTASSLSCVPTDRGTNTAGLIASWHLDESSGGSIIDSSGNGNTGTLVNGPTWVDGVHGPALQFDGNNDYLSVGTSGSLDDPASYPSGSLSLLFWFKPETSPGDEGILEQDGQNYGGFKVRFISQGGSTFLRITMFNGTGGNGVQPQNLDTNVTFQYDTWYHVAMVYDHALQVRRWYVNGENAGEQTTTGIYSPSTDPAVDGVKIGKWSNTRNFQGVLDDVKIYSRALARDELLADMTCLPLKT